MFRFLKNREKKDENKIKEIKQYVPSQSELISLISLKEKIEELKSAYSLIEKRVLNYIASQNISYNNDIGVINSLNLFHDEIVTNMKFMTSNNDNQVYSELIIEFDMLKILFEKLINDINEQQNKLNNLTKKCK